MSEDAFFSSAEARMVRKPAAVSPHCGHCGLFRAGCQTPFMKRAGKGREKILILAEAPGADEDARGEPLVGRTGQYLERELDRLGIEMRADCWLYNAVICRPPDNKLGEHSHAVEDCRPNVLRTVRELRPELILVLGGVAVRSLIGHLWKDDTGPVARWVGWRIPSQQLNAWVCPTFHPSYLLRSEDPVLELMFREHLKRALALHGRPWPDGPRSYQDEVEVILDAEQVAYRLSKYTAGEVAIDFENNPLKPDHARARVVTCSVCWEGQETIAFPWHGAAKEAVADLFQDASVGKIASNMKHETRWALRRLKIRPRNWTWDTMVAAHLLDPRGSISSLKFQSFVRLGQAPYNEHIEPFLIPKKPGGNSPNRIKDISLPLLLKYNGLDSLLEYEVAQIQRKELGVKR